MTEKSESVTINSLSSDISLAKDEDSIAKTHSSLFQRFWPTVIQLGPLSGIFCILLALSSLVASLGILAGSSGHPVADWPIPVSTYLAIFTGIGNLSIRYAAFQGVVITWWLRAYQGCTLATLHWDWKSGTSVKGALTAGRRLGLLGLVCIFSTLITFDGPLLQRASTIVSTAYVNIEAPLNITMAVEIPRGFAGAWSTSEQAGTPQTYFSPSFNETIPTNNGTTLNNIYSSTGPGEVLPRVFRSWADQELIDNVVMGCPSICTAQILAPALWPTKCTTHSVGLDFASVPDNLKVQSQFIALPLSQAVLMVSISLVPGEYESINLITGHANIDSDCAGDFSYTICTLESAIGSYDVIVNGDSILLGDTGPPTLVSLANNTAVNRTWDGTLGGYPSTLAGIVALFYTKWETSAYYHQGLKGALEATIQGGASTQFGAGIQSFCQSLEDPHQTIMQSLNQMMVYAGAAAGQLNQSYLKSRMDPDLSVHTTTTGQVDGYHNVFETTYWCFLAAALIDLACILLIIPTYWNFWKLGRPVSFSPLELAKAFESPLLDVYDSKCSARELATAVRESAVRYGVKRGEKSRLAFAAPSMIDDREDGKTFNSDLERTV